MERFTLLIRADGSPEIGLGHIMRCVALGQFWLANIGEVHFVCREISEPLKRRIENEDFKLHQIHSVQTAMQDALWLRELSAEIHADVLVVDGYQFDDAYQRTAFAGESVSLVFDDYQHAEHAAADCVVNLNLGAEQFDYRTQAKLLLGADYSLLRSEFLTAADSKLNSQTTEASSVNNILVTMGGSDPTDMTFRVAESLSRIADDSNWKVRLLLGSGYRYFDTLETLVRDCSMFEITQAVDNVSPLYQWADLAICAGGGSNWEMSLFGIPRVVIPVADNQIPGTKAMAEKGCCWIADPDKDNDLAEKILALANQPIVRAQMAANSRQLVDGQGSRRISEAVMDLVREKKSNGPESI